MYLAGDVTIIIPVYCRTDEEVKWFGECLESALKQECPVVIVSDASPKPVNKVIYDLWETRMSFQRIPEHRGVSHARNVAANLVSTDLMLPLDCDDTLRSGAVKDLVEAFDGTPLYPDLCKFGTEEVLHYQLLEFDCKHLYTKVGLASVNVLHEKRQWRKVGGWNEHIDFYEDGEYNARLMLSYCGQRYPAPLVNYRIHPSQRTNTNKGRSGYQAKKILEITRGYPSMCCGDKARKKQRIMAASATNVLRRNEMEAEKLPGTQGDRVLALYTGGKGGGKHYYRGPATNWPYKVKHGEFYYVDPTDTKFEGDPLSKSLFIRVVRDLDKSLPEEEEVIVREPRKMEVVKTPVESKKPAFFKPEEEPLPDINSLRWSAEIRHMDFSPEQAEKLLKIEEAGKGRVKVIKHLKKYLK